ncbi:MAG TPA: hypothetical protein VF746_25370 [Longimicrobium sp.]
MPETTEICGVEIELHRDEAGITVWIGKTCLTPAEIVALEVCRANWSRVVRIGEFDFDEAGLEALKRWTAARAEDEAGASRRFVAALLAAAADGPVQRTREMALLAEHGGERLGFRDFGLHGSGVGYAFSDGSACLVRSAASIDHLYRADLVTGGGLGERLAPRSVHPPAPRGRPMIEELEGTVAETLRRLAADTLDPRDETLFCEPRWSQETGTVWELQGGFLGSGYRFHLRHAGEYAGVRELADAIHANRQSAAYRAAWRGFVPHIDRWLRIGRENPWICEAHDPPFTVRSFALCRTAEQVASVVDRNNWSLGTAFVLVGADICMIQQCEGPGEFLMIRGPVAFDSWTTGRPWIHSAKLIAYLEAVARAPLDARGHPQWYELVERDADEERPGVAVAESAADLACLLA